jgi:hypothetical protein
LIILALALSQLSLSSQLTRRKGGYSQTPPLSLSTHTHYHRNSTQLYAAVKFTSKLTSPSKEKTLRGRQTYVKTYVAVKETLCGRRQSKVAVKRRDSTRSSNLRQNLRRRQRDSARSSFSRGLLNKDADKNIFLKDNNIFLSFI